MKRKIHFLNWFFILLILATINSCAIATSTSLPQVQNKDKNNPPGTTRITDNLYIDRIPVTNAMYNEFLESLLNTWSLVKSEKMKSYPKYDLDKDIVFESFNGSGLLYNDSKYVNTFDMISTKLDLEHYVSLPIYSYHPAITMTEEKAALFCKWRTDITNAVYAIKSRNASQRSKYPSSVLYRLPTKNEMEQAQKQLLKEKRFLVFQEQIYNYEGQLDLFKNMQETPALTVYEMLEVASDGVYNPMFNRPMRSYNDESMQTGFRCICEVNP